MKAIVMHYESNSRPKSACTTPVTARSPVWSNSISLPTTPVNCGLQSRSPMMISPVSHQLQAQHLTQSQQEHQRQSALAHHQLQQQQQQQHSVQTQHRHSQAVPSSASSQTLQQQRMVQSQQQQQRYQQMSQNLQGK
ncbi:hypothetical protein B566_EDAN008086, partial [Ephemera danica]